MENNMNTLDKSVTNKDILKFIIFSGIGAFLFLVPIPYNGSYNITVGIIIDYLTKILFVGDFDIAGFMVLLFIVASNLLTFIGYVFKPDFIMKSDMYRNIALTTPLYTVSKFLGLIFIVMTYFGIGVPAINSADTGGVMFGVATTIVVVVLAISFTMPLLTDFGIMEFAGVLLRKIVKPLFTVPGASAIDLMTSVLGSSNAAVILTKSQYEAGFYTAREAVVIAVNFSLVSLPFCYVISDLLGMGENFTVFYLITILTSIILAIIMPRIAPLKKLPDTYDEKAGKKINETIPEGVSEFEWALNLAGKRARTGTAKHVLKSGLDIYLSTFLELIPLVMAWGTVALILVEYTPIFTYISYPMGKYMQLLGIEDAMTVAPATLVGFADMYIPALMVAGLDISVKTKFIIGSLSLVQIIYMTETGIIIVKSKMPVNTLDLFIIFLERTIIGIPIILILTELLTKL